MEAFLKGKTGAIKKKSENVEDIAKSSGRKTSKRLLNIPWVEKYRPKTIEDVAYQEEVIAVLRKTMKGADLPNLLFYGPPGTGKTSTILAAARELFGPLFSERVLELNASDERGIQVVRDKVKKFSQFAASSTRPDGKNCPPYKIVILDEADSMTAPAQAALRRTMEKESRSTRFCLICNYVSRIIEPITSRCSKFRFKPLATDILLNRLQEICEKEEIDCSNEALSAIIENSEGDMRKAITSLQSASRLKGTDPVMVEDINEIAGVVPEELVDELIKMCHSGSYEKLEVVVKNIMLEGHSAGQMFAQLFDKLVSSTDFSNKTKSAVVEQIAIADKCLHDGADEYLQVMTVCTFMMQELCHNL